MPNASKAQHSKSCVTRSLALRLALVVVIVATSLSVAPQQAIAASCGSGTRPGGDGSGGTPWLVATAENLLWVSWATSASNSGSNPTRAEALADNYLQVANVDMVDLTGSDIGCDWNPIGEGNSFSGSYDGAGYTVTGLQTPPSLRDKVGMFGVVSGLVSRVHVRNVSFNGDDSIGGIAGQLAGASGRITESSVTGSVSGRLFVGGLVGYFVQGASVDNSYSRASVPVSNFQNLSTSSAAGLVGYVSNDVTNDVVKSFSTGAVTPFNGSTTNLGGLIGGTPTMTVTASFWDTQTSGQASSGGGTGKTTVDMLTLGTFSSAGWEIVDGWEEYNFVTPTNKWGICSSVNDGYPFLLNEFRANPCVSASPSGSEPSVKAVSRAALHMNLQASAGDSVVGSTVLIEGEGLGPGSPYSLVVRSSPITVKTGLASTGGRFTHFVTLPAGVASGSHTITLSAVGADGTALALTQSFTVDVAGRFSSIGSVTSQTSGGLAETGLNAQWVLIAGGIVGLLLTVGFGLVWSGRHNESATL